MATAVEWIRRDAYYWTGPPGWTICRVGMADGEHFELWFAGDGQLRMAVSAYSLAGAQAAYGQMLHADYPAVAIANGEDPALGPCR